MQVNTNLILHKFGEIELVIFDNLIKRWETQKNNRVII